MSTSKSVEGTSMRDMVMDALGSMASNWGEGSSNAEEYPNPKMKAFFEMIEALRSHCMMVVSHICFQ